MNLHVRRSSNTLSSLRRLEGSRRKLSLINWNSCGVRFPGSHPIQNFSIPIPLVARAKRILHSQDYFVITHIQKRFHFTWRYFVFDELKHFHDAMMGQQSNFHYIRLGLITKEKSRTNSLSRVRTSCINIVANSFEQMETTISSLNFRGCRGSVPRHTRSYLIFVSNFFHFGPWILVTFNGYDMVRQIESNQCTI